MISTKRPRVRAAQVLGGLAALALALLAPRAEASVPVASTTLAPSHIERLSASSFSVSPDVATLDLAAALDVSSLEPLAEAPRFALGEASLHAEPRSERFRLAGAELLSEEPRQGPPVSYPETRIRAFDFLGSTFIGVYRGVSVELQPGCTRLSLGLAEGDVVNRYAYVAWQPNNFTDPLGLVRRTPGGGTDYLGNAGDLINVEGPISQAISVGLDYASNNISDMLLVGPIVDQTLIVGDTSRSTGERVAAGALGVGLTAFSAAGGDILTGGAKVLGRIPWVQKALQSRAGQAIARAFTKDLTTLFRGEAKTLGPATAPSVRAAPLALPPASPTSRTLAQVRALRGERRWQAAEEYVRELYGSPGEQFFRVPQTGGRFVDSPVPLQNGGVLAGEVKTYLGWRTVGGAAVRGEVPLSVEIQSQITKDVWLRKNVAGYDPRWMFMDAPPGNPLARELARQRIMWIQYH